MPDRYIVFDTETDGVHADRKAVEVAMMEIDPITLEEIGRADSLINIGRPIPPDVSAIHGITDDMIKDAPTIEQWVNATFGPGGLEGEVALIGHRVDFDLPLFAPIGTAKWTVDTLLLSQLFLDIETENRKLDTLKEALNLDGGGVSHRAMADVCTAHQLLQYLLPKTGRTLEAIATTEVFMLHHCPWGKHEGKLLMNVPRSYRQWMLGLENLDRHLRYSLEQVAKADFPLPAPGTSRAAKRTLIAIPQRNRK